MSVSKIAVVVLILLGLLFFFGVGAGLHFNGQDEEKARCCEREDCPRKDCSPDWTESLSGLFDSLRPRLDLPPSEQAKLARIPALSSVSLNVPAAESSLLSPPLRMATFRRSAGLVQIVFVPAHPEKIPDSMRKLRDPQKLSLPRTEKRKENDDLQQGSVAIVETGGVLNVACLSNTPCQLELK